MTINHKKKLIFIHIPKNAGTSIIKAMGIKNIFMDKTIEEYKIEYSNYWDKYTKFAVIRDPIDRFISAYKFARMKESGWFSATGQEELSKHADYEICNSVDINGYVDYLYEDKNNYNRWTIPQTFILQNNQGKFEIDYFAKYENLNKDLEKIGITRIEKLNSSTIEKDNLLKLTNKSKKRLCEIYEIDYVNFSYTIPKFNINFSYN
jgi:hypothetical protein